MDGSGSQERARSGLGRRKLQGSSGSDMLKILRPQPRETATRAKHPQAVRQKRLHHPREHPFQAFGSESQGEETSIQDKMFCMRRWPFRADPFQLGVETAAVEDDSSSSKESLGQPQTFWSAAALEPSVPNGVASLPLYGVARQGESSRNGLALESHGFVAIRQRVDKIWIGRNAAAFRFPLRGRRFTVSYAWKQEIRIECRGVMNPWVFAVKRKGGLFGECLFFFVGRGSKIELPDREKSQRISWMSRISLRGVAEEELKFSRTNRCIRNSE